MPVHTETGLPVIDDTILRGTSPRRPKTMRDLVGSGLPPLTPPKRSKLRDLVTKEIKRIELERHEIGQSQKALREDMRQRHWCYE